MIHNKRLIAEENGVRFTEVTLCGERMLLDVAYSITTKSSPVPLPNYANFDDAKEAYHALVLGTKNGAKNVT